MPSAAAYAHRFGNLIRAYQAVGFTADQDYQYLEVNQFLRRLHQDIAMTEDRHLGATDFRAHGRQIEIRGEYLERSVNVRHVGGKPLDEGLVVLDLAGQFRPFGGKAADDVGFFHTVPVQIREQGGA